MNVNGIRYRTIWPKKDKPQIIEIIDQRYLPHRFVIEELQTLDDFAAAIRDMHVRGAGLIGATAAYGIYSAALHAPRKNPEAYFAGAARKLLDTRPTAKNLSWAVQRQLTAIAGISDPEARIQKAFDTAGRIADEDADFCRRIGEHGLRIIKEISRKKHGEPVNILTHCNAGWLAFVDYGSATAPIYAAHRENIPVHVWVDETRPWNQGSKLTAWEMFQEGIPHTLIADNTGGHLMQHSMVDLVIVGSDRTTRTGDVANKIGTYLKALAAKDNDVPFYVALPSSTIDWELRDGLREIPIENRSGDEVKFVSGLSADNELTTVLCGLPETPASNYAFDVTPARLVSGIITERGIAEASEESLLKLFPEFA
ncbi:MAG: methylthioribose-1-phosphate isomerase [Desulfobacterales bacterium SG8_35]|nr:MAG: methylthioribose-1-phosphate isomerase [Desulfobacterales bacterium SG8_35]